MEVARSASPPYDTFHKDATITLTSSGTAAPGGRICYTLDGGVPACDDTGVVVACGGTGVVHDYTNGNIAGPAGPSRSASRDTTLRAITSATGYGPGSTTSEAQLDFTADAPLVTPAAGSYAGAQDIKVQNGVMGHERHADRGEPPCHRLRRGRHLHEARRRPGIDAASEPVDEPHAPRSREPLGLRERRAAPRLRLRPLTTLPRSRPDRPRRASGRSSASRSRGAAPRAICRPSCASGSP